MSASPPPAGPQSAGEAGATGAARAAARPESQAPANAAARPGSNDDTTAPATMEPIRRGQAELVNAVGLHARPAVRFTQSAKGFQSRIEVSLAAEGPWADAKSPVQVMRLRAPLGSVLHLQVQGADADAALETLLSLVRRGFEGSEAVENSEGLANSRGVENSRG